MKRTQNEVGYQRYRAMEWTNEAIANALTYFW